MSLELLSVSEMAQADAWASEHGASVWALMQAAGKAVADAMCQRWSARRVLVICGPGHNGGDGMVAATHLRLAGWSVRLQTLHEPGSSQACSAALAQAWAMWCEAGGQATRLDAQALDSVDMILDAAFGAGLNRELPTSLQQLLAAAERAGKPLVAIDVPSGVWGDSGHAQGAQACALTVTFFRRKRAHVLWPARALCGEVVVADIGLDAAALAALRVRCWRNGPDLWSAWWPQQDPAAHKYHRGHALVWGGARTTGAPRLAALAAARIGAGLTSLCVPESAWPIYAGAMLSVMVKAVTGEGALQWSAGLQTALEDPRVSALLIGPGAGAGCANSGLRALVCLMLASARPVVLDADALTAFEDDPQLLFAAIAAHSRPVVLTPHEGEFARLFGEAGVVSQGDAGQSPAPPSHTELRPVSKIERAQRAARLSQAIVVLKGADTVIAAPDGRVAVNDQAPACLATAGTGDVLAGMVCGLLAQGMAAWPAACAAVWLHGRAALRLGPGMLAEDLPEALPQVLAELQGQIGLA